ncbi:MAG: hypothetical protein M4579_000389 [Chaenotheca gracillima]|nr:MAG: hypothetical protein M4579_000389 [Chaenotheca gracillima]
MHHLSLTRLCLGELLLLLASATQALYTAVRVADKNLQCNAPLLDVVVGPFYNVSEYADLLSLCGRSADGHPTLGCDCGPNGVPSCHRADADINLYDSSFWPAASDVMMPVFFDTYCEASCSCTNGDETPAVQWLSPLVPDESSEGSPVQDEMGVQDVLSKRQDSPDRVIVSSIPAASPFPALSESDLTFLTEIEIDTPPYNGTNGTLILDRANDFATFNQTVSTPEDGDDSAPFNGTVWFNDTAIFDETSAPDFSNHMFCACNCTYVSWLCCDAPDGIVHEPASNNMGNIQNCTETGAPNATSAAGPTGIELVGSGSLNPAIKPTGSPKSGASAPTGTELAASGSLPSPVGTMDSSKAPLTTVGSSPTPSASLYCKNALCWSWYGCSDSDCYCGLLSTSALYSHCLPKAGAGQGDSNPGKARRDRVPKFLPRQQSSTIEARAADFSSDSDEVEMRRAILPPTLPLPAAGTIEYCPCNCTYISTLCCSTPSGIVYEDSSNNLGKVAGPLGTCCNEASGAMQNGTAIGGGDTGCSSS